MTTSTPANQSGLMKTWELSLYELNREPQRAVTDETAIKVSPRSLYSELICPICLDLLKKTYTTKECLHRFCSDCIATALRSGNKECPTCRKKLASKRCLRPDPNFDLLIQTLYPNREEYEAHQIKAIEKLNRSQSQAALVQSINEGIKVQNQARIQRINKRSQNESEGNVNSQLMETQIGPQPSTSSNVDTASNGRVRKKQKNFEDKNENNDLSVDFDIMFKLHPNENQSSYKVL